MSFNKVNLMEETKKLFLTSGFSDDFWNLDTTLWTSVLTDTGTAAEDQDGINGLVTLLPSDGSVADNDEAYIYTNECTKFLNGKSFYLGARLQFTEAATNAANILFGIGEGFGPANTLQDNGGGPPADYDGCCFFKVDGNTRWFFETSLGTSQQTFELDYVAGQAGFTTLILECEVVSATEIVVTPWIDQTGRNALVQALPYSANFNPRRVPVQSRFAYSSPGEMAICFGVKNGSANQQQLDVDLCFINQVR